MNIATIIAVIALVLVVFLAVRYIYKEKKKGSRCVGCPFAQECQKYHAEKAACLHLDKKPQIK